MVVGASSAVLQVSEGPFPFLELMYVHGSNPQLFLTPPLFSAPSYLSSSRHHSALTCGVFSLGSLLGISDAYYCAECTRLEKDRDGCPKIVNLGASRTDLFYERRRLGEFASCSRPVNVYLTVFQDSRRVDLWHIFLSEIPIDLPLCEASPDRDGGYK
jgi:hypothetical protein